MRNMLSSSHGTNSHLKMLPSSFLYVIIGLQVMVCQETPQLVIFVADLGPPNLPGAIYKLRIHHMNLTTLNILNVVKPVDIKVDKQRNHIYWTDTNTNQIRRADVDGGNDVIVATPNSTSNPEGLTLDGNTRQVFYTDTGNDVIVRIEMSNYQSTVIVNTGLDKPRGIVADTTNRKLFWVDRGNNTKIETSDYDGNQRQTLVSSGLFLPSGITLDQRAGRIYWTDVGGFVESVLLNGTDRKRVQTVSGKRLNGIDIFYDFIYFTALENGAIYALTETGSHRSILTAQRFQDPTGISVFSPNVDTIASCPYGQFGRDCAKCGACSEGSPCEKTTGVCLQECDPGYKLENCTKECDPGTFGVECKYLCSRNCKSGSVCDPVTGHCPNGCNGRWTGANCTTFSGCPDNTYGDQCAPCGRCGGETSCNSASGHCENGCQPGWTGDKCDAEAQTGGPPIGLIVGIAVAVTVVIVIVVVAVAVVVVRKQRQRQDELYVEFDSRNKDNSAYATLGSHNTTPVFSVQRGQGGTLGEAFS